MRMPSEILRDYRITELERENHRLKQELTLRTGGIPVPEVRAWDTADEVMIVNSPLALGQVMRVTAEEQKLVNGWSLRARTRDGLDQSLYLDEATIAQMNEVDQADWLVHLMAQVAYSVADVVKKRRQHAANGPGGRRLPR